MAQQTVKEWFLAILRAFNKAGAHAATAALAGAVIVDGMDMWSRVGQMLEFGAAAFLIKGLTGALEYIAEDSAPGDDPPTVNQ